MFNAIWRAMLAALLALTATFAAAAPQSAVAPGAAQMLTTRHDGVQRQYLVYVPRALTTSAARPALVMLHGSGMDARGMAAITELQAAAEAHGFVAVLPQTPSREPWENGRPRRPGTVMRDDVGFVRQVLAEVTRYQRVTAQRIYVAGVSSGGMMAMRLDCEAAGAFRAVASVSGLLAEGLVGCRPSRALPQLVMQGTIDDVIPFAGMQGVKGFADTRAHWIAANGCTATTRPIAQPDAYDDGTTVSLERVGHCAGRGVELAFWVIEGGGHVWPGMPSNGKRAAQVNSREVSATDAVVAFFERYGL